MGEGKRLSGEEGRSIVYRHLAGFLKYFKDTVAPD
jgi:hypothetical protein